VCILLETNKKNLGLIFRQYRKSKSLTQFQVAEMVGLNERQISRIESGLNYPTYITFAKLTEVLNINITEFYKNDNILDSKIKQNLIKTIKGADETELSFYDDIIKSVKKNVKLMRLKG